MSTAAVAEKPAPTSPPTTSRPVQSAQTTAPSTTTPAAKVETEPAKAASQEKTTTDPASKEPATGASEANGKEPAARGAATSIFDGTDDEDEQGESGAGKQPAEGAADGEGGDAETEEVQSWPDDWRERIANGDDKLLGELKRYASFDNWARAQRALRQKMSSGELKRAAEEFSPDWDDQKKAAWRKENGIPETPAGYQIPEVKGYEWSETEMIALVNPFLDAMHANNAPPKHVQDSLAFYAATQQRGKEARVGMDREHKVETEDVMRPKWGADYRQTVNLIERVLKDRDVLPGGMEKGGAGAAIMQARLEDGRRLINVPDVVEFLGNLARSHYGEGAMLPSAEVAQINSREQEIRRVMTTDIDRYYREGLHREMADIQARKSGKRAA